MASPPSSALAGAAVAAMALADAVDGLVRTLPIPANTAQAAAAVCRQARTVDAPRIAAPAAVAALAARLIGAVQSVARACAPADAAPGLYACAALARSCAPTSYSPALTRTYTLAGALCLGVEMACLGEAFLAEARTGFADQDAASAARARIRAGYDGAADRIAAALGEAVLAIFSASARATTAYLVEEAASLRPLVQVQAAASQPAAAAAWALYGDPERAGELMERNRVGTPFHMPPTFVAVSPGSP